MVSLSSTESLKIMAENYGFGASLFSKISLEQMEKLQEIKPDFKIYLAQLFSGEINDPESLSILEEKYKNNLWIHEPTLFDLDLAEFDNINDLLSNDDIDSLQAGLSKMISNLITPMINQLRRGDVIYAKYREHLEAYYIYSSLLQLQNVYFRYKKLELIEPVLYFNIFGSTPANYWNGIHIPKLSFEFQLNLLLHHISWHKITEQNQNYLVGEFVYQKKKVYLFTPLDTTFKTAAEKLAVNLQLSNKTNFLTKDPKGIIPDHPLVFFADLNLDLQNIQSKIVNEDLDED